MDSEGKAILEGVMNELDESVYCLQVELQRLKHNLGKLHGQQEQMSDVCEVLVHWMEKSQFLKEKMKKQFAMQGKSQDSQELLQ